MRSTKQYGLVNSWQEHKMLVHAEHTRQRETRRYQIHRKETTMSKVHFCDEVGCHQIIPFNQRYCDQHAKLHQWHKPMHPQQSPQSKAERIQRLNTYKHYNQYHRDKEANAFYHSAEWTSVRNYVVNRDMYCDAIDGKVIADHDLIVDHIVRRDMCDDPLDTSNLWCLSRRHHWIKTKLEEEMMAKPNGKNIIRHCSKKNWIKYIKEFKNTNRKSK